MQFYNQIDILAELFLKENTIMFEYGLVIVFITILTRVFVVGISWNYGLFLVALKQSFPNAQFSELGKRISEFTFELFI